MKTTANTQEAMRLQKWLAQAGVASRRKAEEIIQAGRVCVNGKVITELGAKANPITDKVTVDGKLAELNRQEKIYIMLHKPEGVVTTVTDPFGRATVVDILPPEMTRLYPVGRLDYDTSGLIFLTNDGNWTQKITHPKYEAKKTYIAMVKGVPSEQLLKKIREGLKIDNKITAPCEAVIDKNYQDQSQMSQLRIIIHEGRNRQVRKMCDAIGHPVVTLKRVAIGNVKLGDLKKGEWRYLTAQEVKRCLKS